MRTTIFIFTTILLLAFTAGDKTPSFLKIDALKKRIANGNDTTFVVNFWATWCGPCVKELHYFTELDSASKGKKIKVILVSLDFKNEIQSKLVPFLKKKNIRSEVFVLDETNDNEWIPKVDSLWQGNIPATLIQNSAKKYRTFLPRETTLDELDSLVGICK